MRLAKLAATALAVAVLCGANAASAQDGRWLRAESANFIVHGDIGERPLRQSVETLERFDAWLRFLLGSRAPPSDNKLDLYIFRNSLEEIYPGVSSAVRGFYYADPEVTAAFAIYRTEGLAAQEVLFHEYAHHFMLRYFAGVYPKWFVEGFAEFVATTDFQEDVAWVGASNPGRRLQLERDAWVPMNRMLAGDLHGRDVGRFYAQSWLMTNYILLNSERKAGFARYLAAIRAGGDPVTSFQPAFGVDLQQFQNELRRHLAVGVAKREIPFPRPASTPIAIQRLPPSFDNLLTLEVLLRGEYGLKEDKEGRVARVITRALAEADRYPNDLLAQRVRAMALMARRDYAQARTVLEPLLAANADNYELPFLMGRSYLAEADAGPPENAIATATQGRRYFARVFRLNPRHAPTLYAYARTFGHPFDEGTMDVLLEAHRLAPQVREISLYTGVALMELRRGSEAVPILEAVAYAPHAGRSARRALQLLEAAKKNEAPPAEEPASEDEEDEDED